MIASVSFGKDADTPNGSGDYWADVDDLFWVKKDGSRGSSVTQKVFEKVMAYDHGCDITEQVSEQLSYEAYEERQQMKGLTVTDVEELFKP